MPILHISNILAMMSLSAKTGSFMGNSFNDQVIVESSSSSARLAYVDFKLLFTGRVSRADLKNAFGIAEASASRVLTEYSRFRPNNKTQKTNTIKRDLFEPLFIMDAQLALGMLANGFNSNKVFGLTELSYEKIGNVPNLLKTHDVAIITRAISGKYSISCNYFLVLYTTDVSLLLSYPHHQEY